MNQKLDFLYLETRLLWGMKLILNSSVFLSHVSQRAKANFGSYTLLFKVMGCNGPCKYHHITADIITTSYNNCNDFKKPPFYNNYLGNKRWSRNV